MPYWNKIIESHVVKVFRNITHDWWGIDVHFYDKFGNCKNNGIPLRNPLCSLLQSKTKTKEDCLQFRIENLKELNKPHKNFVCKCYENLRVIVVPIYIMGDYVGTMMCSGMQFPINNAHKEKSVKELTKLGFDKMEVEQRYNKIKISTLHTEGYVLNLMKLVAEDIASFYKTIYKEEEAKKKQAFFPNRVYKERYKSIIGKSPAMKMIFDRLELIENSENPVLIEGESGTGKELIASAIHYNSFRKDRAFIIQNCSAFSDSLLSTELFGHEKGSFTGAVLEKKGLFEIADGGTLFLDEIGDMSIGVQGRLLRVLENGTFYRVGGTEQKEVDVRIITATNKDLTKQIEEGLFRKDLFYRINALRISVPPLRDRREDILPLFYHFLEYYTNIRNIEKKEINPTLIKLLVNHNWPGNVRELENVVKGLITLSGKSKTIEPEHLPVEVIQAAYLKPSSIDHKGNKKLHGILKSIEKEITEKALQRAYWNKTIASKELGISRASLNRRIARFNIRQKSP